MGTTVVVNRLFTLDCNGEFCVWNADEETEPQWGRNPDDLEHYGKKEYSLCRVGKFTTESYRKFTVKDDCNLAVEKNRYLYFPTKFMEPEGITKLDLRKLHKEPIEPLWETNVPFATTPVFSQGIIITGNGPVTALDAETGKILWVKDLISMNKTQIKNKNIKKILSTPAVSNNCIYISTKVYEPEGYVGYLYVLQKQNGKIIEQHKISGASQDVDHNIFHSSPAVVDGWVYVGSTDGCLYAFQGKE